MKNTPMNSNEANKQRKGKTRRPWLKLILAGVLALAGLGAYIGWDRGFREHPQPDWVTRDDATRFMYGSIGAERDAGIPYWIFYILPRLFPEKFPGPGGYTSLGVPWEEGHELPVGFTKKTIGFPRIANNCAVCHTMKYRTSPAAKPVFVPLGPAHTSNVEAFFRLLIDCAKDPRFTPDNILLQINLATKLDWIDQLLYRFLVIPITKKRLLEREQQFQWIYNEAYPDWGRGRDDAMNLTKYFMIAADPPDDGSFGPTDFPAIWNLKKYDPIAGEAVPQRMNLAGDSWDAYSVVMDSALGLMGAEPHDKENFVSHVQWITDYAKRTPAPVFPFPIDENKSRAGKVIFDQHCDRCHGEEHELVGRPMPLAEVGTSRDRIDTWGKEFAIKANQVATDMGLERRGLVEEDLIGYNVPHLDGIWLRAPYLHNGSVPSLRDLLTPPAQRPELFFRGYDVYDAVNVGFIAQGPEAEKAGTPHDVMRKGNGNQGHAFGTDLQNSEIEALLEYLKSL
jgi:mono/diheme cytochrome c family protein